VTAGASLVYNRLCSASMGINRQSTPHTDKCRYRHKLTGSAHKHTHGIYYTRTHKHTDTQRHAKTYAALRKDTSHRDTDLERDILHY
jgi:hypothetical protein